MVLVMALAAGQAPGANEWVVLTMADADGGDAEVPLQDVVQLTVSKVGDPTAGKIVLTKEYAGAGRVKILNQAKTAQVSEVPIASCPATLWVEGTTTSSGVRDVTIKGEWVESGTCPDPDSEKVTVYEVDTVKPDQTTKVMISTKHDDEYPSSYQTEDRKIKVVAKVKPVVAGATVHFRSKDPDPDDGSPYDTADPDDNRGTPKRGSLSPSQADTNAQGEAEVILTVTDRYAGDNYIVQSSHRSSFASLKESGTLVAWKRVYVEEDKMFKKGTDLAADFTADGNSDADVIQVVDASGFAVNDSIVIFDADHPSGETRTISAINGNNITVADLTNSYNAGYASGDKGAAIGRPADGYYDAELSSGTIAAFGVVTSGVDGGCFVECKRLPDTETPVPFRSNFGVTEEAAMNAIVDFANVWFANRTKTNYFCLLGACTLTRLGDEHYGKSNADVNIVSVFLGEIQREFTQDAFQANATTVAHEIGHQFSQQHCTHRYTWMGSGDPCTMNVEGDPEAEPPIPPTSLTDQTVEFHQDHLYTIRDSEDNY
jgi:hypothetical protein